MCFVVVALRLRFKLDCNLQLHCDFILWLFLFSAIVVLIGCFYCNLIVLVVVVNTVSCCLCMYMCCSATFIVCSYIYFFLYTHIHTCICIYVYARLHSFCLIASLDLICCDSDFYVNSMRFDVLREVSARTHTRANTLNFNIKSQKNMQQKLAASTA